MQKIKTNQHGQVGQLVGREKPLYPTDDKHDKTMHKTEDTAADLHNIVCLK